MLTIKHHTTLSSYSKWGMNMCTNLNVVSLSFCVNVWHLEYFFLFSCEQQLFWRPLLFCGTNVGITFWQDNPKFPSRTYQCTFFITIIVTFLIFPVTVPTVTTETWLCSYKMSLYWTCWGVDLQPGPGPAPGSHVPGGAATPVDLKL